MSCPSWNWMFSLTGDFRVWCPQPNEFVSVNPWRVRVISPMRQKLPPVVGPDGRLVWEVVPFCHLRDWWHSFECSVAQWAVCHCLLQAWADSFCLSATSCCQYLSQCRQRPQTVPSLPSPLGLSAAPVQSQAGLGLCCLMLKIMKGEGEEKNEKWWARVRDLPLVLCGLFFLF